MSDDMRNDPDRYRANVRMVERADKAERRAQRAEAECERLREALKSMYDSALSSFWPTELDEMKQAREALAPTETKPEQCSHRRVEGNGSKYLCVDCGRRFISMLSTGAPQNPDRP